MALNFKRRIVDNPNLPDEIIQISQINCVRFGLDPQNSPFTTLSDFEQSEAEAKKSPALEKQLGFLKGIKGDLWQDGKVSIMSKDGDLRSEEVLAPDTQEKAYKNMVYGLTAGGMLSLEDAKYMEDHFHMRNVLPESLYDGDLWENLNKRKQVKQELAEIISQDREKEAEARLSMSPFAERKYTLGDESVRFVVEYEKANGNRDGVVKELVNYLVKSNLLEDMARDGAFGSAKGQQNAEEELITRAVLFSVPETNRIAREQMERNLHKMVEKAIEEREKIRKEELERNERNGRDGREAHGRGRADARGYEIDGM